MTRPLLQWDDAFLIGIEELDYEHRALVEDINKLHRELADHEAKDEIEKVLGDIHARMESHFALEEHYMQDHHYPHYLEHKGEHARLLDDYVSFMVAFENDRGVDDSTPIEDTLKHWIVDHILNSDKKMALMAK